MSDKPSKQTQVSLTTEGDQDFLQLRPQGGGPVAWIDSKGAPQGTLAGTDAPGGADTAIQFSDGGIFGGQATDGSGAPAPQGMSWDKTTGQLTIVAAPGGFSEIVAGPTSGMALQFDNSPGNNVITIGNDETNGTVVLIADGLLSISSESASVQIQDQADNPMVEVGGTARLGFYGASTITKPTVTGAKGGNAALTSLIAQLVNLGLITDGTS
jgi:hypothetical protein